MTTIMTTTLIALSLFVNPVVSQETNPSGGESETNPSGGASESGSGSGSGSGFSGGGPACAALAVATSVGGLPGFDEGGVIDTALTQMATVLVVDARPAIVEDFEVVFCAIVDLIVDIVSGSIGGTCPEIQGRLTAIESGFFQQINMDFGTGLVALANDAVTSFFNAVGNFLCTGGEGLIVFEPLAIAQDPGLAAGGGRK